MKEQIFTLDGYSLHVIENGEEREITGFTFIPDTDGVTVYSGYKGSAVLSPRSGLTFVLRTVKDGDKDETPK